MARKLPQFRLPKQLSSDKAGTRALLALLSSLFIVLQVFGNLPDSALRRTMQPARNTLDQLGLYERGWGMFASTNTHTSVVRNEFIYANGDIKHIQYIYLRPGYKVSVWNEVMQDLQYDDNNDRSGAYLNGFLRYTCDQYDTEPGNPLLSVAFQQQVARFPYSKKVAEKTLPFTTIRTRLCQDTPTPGTAAL